MALARPTAIAAIVPRLSHAITPNTSSIMLPFRGNGRDLLSTITRRL
jgi:hypothetical protein